MNNNDKKTKIANELYALFSSLPKSSSLGSDFRDLFRNQLRSRDVYDFYDCVTEKSLNMSLDSLFLLVKRYRILKPALYEKYISSNIEIVKEVEDYIQEHCVKI